MNMGFIPKYLTFSKFGQIYQYTSCLLSKFRFHTNIPHFGGPVYQYTSCFLKIPAIYQYTACMIWARKKGIPIYLMFSKMAKYTNIPQFNEYQETITSPLLYRYLPYIICAQCMNNVIWIFLVSTWNCRVKLIEILSVPAVPWYHTLLGYSTSRDWNLGVTRDWNLGVTHSTTV